MGAWEHRRCQCRCLCPPACRNQQGCRIWTQHHDTSSVQTQTLDPGRRKPPWERRKPLCMNKHTCLSCLYYFSFIHIVSAIALALGEALFIKFSPFFTTTLRLKMNKKVLASSGPMLSCGRSPYRWLAEQKILPTRAVRASTASRRLLPARTIFGILVYLYVYLKHRRVL